MEEQKTYTYEKDTRKPVNKIKVILAAAALLMFAVAVAGGIRLGKARATREYEAASAEASRLAAEATTAPEEVYPTGPYMIQTGGYTLLLRESPSRESQDLFDIPDGASINISEVTQDPAASDANYRYWGKTQYEGKTGWVPMHYLEPQQD